jgi:hypothetical protein
MKLVLIAAFRHQVIRANAIVEADDLTWDEKYDLIFCDELSGKCFDIAKKLDNKIEYYDPDTTYEEDVMAFVEAIRAYDTKYQRLSRYME